MTEQDDSTVRNDGAALARPGGSHNDNITFRDCHMHKTVKGIYMKVAPTSPTAGPHRLAMCFD